MEVHHISYYGNGGAKHDFITTILKFMYELLKILLFDIMKFVVYSNQSFNFLINKVCDVKFTCNRHSNCSRLYWLLHPSFFITQNRVVQHSKITFSQNQTLRRPWWGRELERQRERELERELEREREREWEGERVREWERGAMNPCNLHPSLQLQV